VIPRGDPGSPQPAPTPGGAEGSGETVNETTSGGAASGETTGGGTPPEGGNLGLLPRGDGSDPGPLRPGDGSDPSPPLAESARPHAAGRHRRRRPLAPKGTGPRRLHAALTALAAFLVIVTVVLVATDNGKPPAPNGTAAQQPGPVTEPDGQIAPPPNWKLAFSTDFPGTALDTSTWAQCYPWSPAPPGCSNFGNADEREWYLPSQVHVDNGALALVAQRTPTQGSDEDGNPKTYTCRSGMVTTYPSVHLKYGFVQVTARLPFGKGLWPAIWLIPADQSWPPEIDIVEHWDTQPAARATLHYGKQNSQQRGTVNFPDADKGWHTYTLYWTQNRITIYYDHQLALTTTAHIPQQSMYLLLDLADENNTPGSCSGTMYVKSVNIWKPPPTPVTG
jgi:beta-glucanase (GH16 family)